MPHNFFYDTGLQVLTADEKSFVSSLVNKCDNDFKGYITTSGTPDGSEYLYGPSLVGNVGILKILAKVSLPCFPMILRHTPGAKVVRHKDEQRNAVLSIPIEPIDYSPTYFWEDLLSTEYSAVSTFPNMNACLLNTQEYHDLTNTSSFVRLTFQFCFYQNFDYVKQKILDKTLWNCNIS